MLQSRKSKKKLVKPLKNCFFGPNLHRRGHYGPRSRWKKIFLAEIKKADHQLSESFYFIKISNVLTELWIFFYLECCFLSKKCHFQQKQLILYSLFFLSSQNAPFSFPFKLFLISSYSFPLDWLVYHISIRKTPLLLFNSFESLYYCLYYPAKSLLMDKKLVVAS